MSKPPPKTISNSLSSLSRRKGKRRKLPVKPRTRNLNRASLNRKSRNRRERSQSQLLRNLTKSRSRLKSSKSRRPSLKRRVIILRQLLRSELFNFIIKINTKEIWSSKCHSRKVIRRIDSSVNHSSLLSGCGHTCAISAYKRLTKSCNQMASST